MNNNSEFPKLFREIREQKGVSIEELAEQTKIFSYYLKMFEEGKKEKFPPYPISKGYLKAVARELDVDPNIILKSFDEFVQEKKEIAAQETVSISKEKREKIIKERNIKSIKYIVVFILIIAIFSLSIYLVHQMIAKRNFVANKVPNNAVTQEKSNNIEKANNVISSQKTIYLKFIGKSWVLVKDKDKVLFEGIINPGEEKTFTTSGILNITLGNAGGVEISKDGKSWVKAGNVGEVVELTE
ncbi:transcriptional regulator, XRE family [Thermodesulfobium narugense DSM 14796]|uniref:Transcriptional regulator, XRE family n=1 Tax=Thermodesulfobium narugense DSM 14796 TaxID=747365 RepID=M1E8C7_9BACT|nr:helix-turn-helix domain-containing protein [Thermodesulfobium narugense]AEE14860.1 transcriptional regulator, XRE family [Thermodesulfobium narugense DSM 14796]